MSNERLVDYLIPLVEDKKEVKVADIGCGPIPKTGQYLKGVNVTIYSSDKQDFTDTWIKYNIDPPPNVEYQDMEKLSYPNEFFDIVHCVNALDHTRHALAAVKEMIRICKTGGWVYIDCNLDQKDTGYKHFWNAKEDGTFTNNIDTFDLKDFGFTIKYVDNGGERRHNQIIATLKK